MRIALCASLFVAVFACKSTTGGSILKDDVTPDDGDSAESAKDDLSCKAKGTLFGQLNSGAWAAYPNARKSQIKMLSSSVSNFYRTAPVVFYAELLAQRSQWNKDLRSIDGDLGDGLVFGDPHVGNMAGYMVDGNLLPLINDFDDVTTAPRIFDVIRGFVSILVFYPDADSDKIASAFASGYADGLAGHDGHNDLKSLFDEEKLSPVAPKVPDDDASIPAGVKAQAMSMIDAYVSNNLQGSSGGSPGDCKKASYLVKHGGSSQGLPRFREVCGDRVIELKSCRSASYDFADGSPTTDNDQRVANAATQLNAAHGAQGVFQAAGSPFTDGAAQGFAFYIHDRYYYELPIDKVKSKNAPLLGAILAKAIAAGHSQTGQVTLSQSQVATLTSGLKKEADNWAKMVKDDAKNVPDCIP